MTAPGLGCEDPHPDEERIVQTILEVIERSLAKDYGAAVPGRRFHAKSLGLADAVLEVERGIPRELQVGLFASPRTFPAVVRFTNAARMPGADGDRSIKGMAIKILAVPSTGPALELDPCGLTQDLVLITSTVFFPGTVRTYALSLRGLFGSLLCLLAVALNPFNWRSLIGMARRQRRVPNLLEASYASCTPYLFGDGRAIKWHARPCQPARSTLPDHPDRDFLRQRLRDDLTAGTVAFEICVQPQVDPRTEPIEDSAVEWHTPLVKVATLTLQTQDIATVEHQRRDDTFTFSPWHAIPEHRPLGGINRLRRRIYAELSRRRAGGR
jgi:hypothetical protein